MKKLSKEVLEEEYITKKKNIKEIAELHHLATGTIFNYLKDYGIPTRKTMTIETRIKISNTCKGKPSKLKGRPLSEKHKDNISKSKRVGIGNKSETKAGYIRIYFPDHPKSDAYGYILEHDLIMECYIGRWLKENEVVHHINGDRKDNRLKNLQLMTRSEHTKLHRNKRKER